MQDFIAKVWLVFVALLTLRVHFQTLSLRNPQLSGVVSRMTIQAAQRQQHEQDVTWEEYKARFGKEYEAGEDLWRSKNFYKNTVDILTHNDAGHGFTMAVNQFTDWSSEEIRSHRHGLNFASRRLMLDARAGQGNETMTYGSCNNTFVTPDHFVAPARVDWRKHGLVTPAKDQGHCLSCYSFSTTGAVEGQHAKKTGQLLSLSEQQIVDCSKSFGNQKCQGGLMDNSFEYIHAVGGIETEQSYPYIDRLASIEEKCKADPKKFAATVSGCVDIPSGDEQALMNAVALGGPVSIAILAQEDFSFYSDGIYSSGTCCNKINCLDHGILVVGYDSQDGQDYWIVKNSWAETWGQNGFGKIARNKDNMCGVATFASYPLV